MKPDEHAAPERQKTPSLERWLIGRAGVGPRHHFGYRIAPHPQGGMIVEVLSRGIGPATTVDRFLAGPSRIDVPDRRVFEELRRAALGPRQAYIVSAGHAGRVLKLLCCEPKNPHVIDARTLKPVVFRGQLSPALVDHRDQDRVRLEISWHDQNGNALRLSGVPTVVFDELPPLLWAGSSVFTAPERVVSDTFRRLVSDPVVDFEVGSLAQSVSRLEALLVELGIGVEWLAERLDQPVDTSPKFRLVLSFVPQGDGPPAVRAEANVHVGEHAFALDESEVPEAVWLPADPPKWGRRVARDRNAERAASQLLKDTGFTHLERDLWDIRGDEALDLVRRELAPLIGHFELFWLKQPTPSMFRTQALTSRLKVSETGRGEWFEVNVEFATGAATVPIAEVLGQVESGSRFIKLSDGTYAEATPALRQAVKVLKSLLEDATSTGRARLSATDVGDLQGLIEVADGVEIAPAIERALAPLRDFSAIEQIPVPEAFGATLRDYQKEGLSWLAFLYERKLGGILADDMGLGKTVQTLAVLSHLQKTEGRKPSLVVCPTSVVENWVRETHRFVPDFVVHRIDGPHRDGFLADALNADVLVTSYALLRRDFEKLKPINFRYAILDEAQAIKNPASQTAQCARQLNADLRLALTGTPIENRLSELWSIFHFVSPPLLGTLSDFRTRYLAPIERYSDETRLHRLRRRVRPFVLRREKEVVAKELPPKTVAQVFCDVPKATQTLYREIAERARQHISLVMRQKGFERSTVSVLTELLRLRQVACDPQLVKNADTTGVPSPKVEPFLELVDEALASGRKILVFSQFVSMLDILGEELKAKKIDYLTLTGATRRRQQVVDRFQADDGPRVFLISLKAGGSGLNLTAADCVIHFDPWWNPAVEEQATDRAHRIGQTKPVFVYELVARGTVEEKILKLKERKRQLADGVLGVDGALGKLLTEDEVMALFGVDEWSDL